MKYHLPHQPSLEFEIPDKWRAAANMENWKPVVECYTATSDLRYSTIIVPISEVAAPIRNEGVPWFAEARIVQVLRGFRSGELLPAIDVDGPSDQTCFRYRVRDGFHRFYASAAVRFTHLPVSVRPYFDINAL
jgi:hypothetical protein